MIFCTACGTQNTDEMKFCVKCGAPFAAPPAGSWRGSSDLENPVVKEPSSPLSAPYAPPSNPPYTPPPVTPAGMYQPNNYQYSAAFQMNYAQWIDRVIAAIIDSAIVFALVMIIWIVMMIVGVVSAVIHEALAALVFFLSFLIIFASSIGFLVYNKAYLVSKRGYSIGHGIMKLKVVTEQGSLVSTGTAVIRILVQFGLNFIPFGGIVNGLWPLWDEKRQALHDKVANTYVIKT
jgi:uncharacterized RDD family membrane protein YckC